MRLFKANASQPFIKILANPITHRSASPKDQEAYGPFCPPLCVTLQVDGSCSSQGEAPLGFIESDTEHWSGGGRKMGGGTAAGLTRFTIREIEKLRLLSCTKGTWDQGPETLGIPYEFDGLTCMTCMEQSLPPTPLHWQT